MNKSNQLKFILKSLQVLLNSGVPLETSLKMIENKIKSKKTGRFGVGGVSSKHRKLLTVVAEIRAGLSNGRSFEDVLYAIFGDSFPQSLKLFIKIGESSGNLGPMISKGLETVDKMKKIKDSLIGALSYPIFILSIAMVMILAMLIFIVPKIVPIFRDLKVELPTYTKILILVSGFISEYFVIILISAFLFGASVFFVFTKLKKVRDLVDRAVFKIPIINRFLVNYNLATISVCLSQYLKSGYSMHESLTLISDSVRNVAYLEACKKIADDLKNGLNLSDAISRHEKIMPDWSDAIQFAVNSGNLSEQFNLFYIESSGLIDEFGMNLKRWSEPILILGIGGIVTLFAISIIGPIYGLVQHIGN